MAEESNEKFWQFVETVRELAVYKQTGKWCTNFSIWNLYLHACLRYVLNGN